MPDINESIFRPAGVPGAIMPPQPLRTPPSAVQAEQAFLGALLANNKVLDRAPFLEPHHFSDSINGRIFHEARRLIGENSVADPVTLRSVFEQSGILNEIGGTAYLSQLITAMVGIINAGDYARLVREKWLRRQLIDIGEVLVNDSYGTDDATDPVKTAMDAIAMIDAVCVGTSLNDTRTSLDTAMGAALAAMEQARLNGKPPGLSTGFRCIDDRLGGLEPGLVYVLGGRPASGKSALGHQIAINAARDGASVLELSLEMSALQLGRRALAAASKVPLFAMKSGNISDLDATRLVCARKELSGLRLTIDDAGGQTPKMIAAKCRAAKRKGLDLVMLDHLNLTRADDQDARHGATYAIEKASNTMLQIAKDCGVAVLLLTQLNRSVEGREDKRPGLSDLRQSGAVEQDCYAAGFLYREEYYLQNAPEQKGGESDDQFNVKYSAWREHLDAVTGKADLIWGKVRDGEPGTDSLFFDGKTTSFSEDRC